MKFRSNLNYLSSSGLSHVSHFLADTLRENSDNFNVNECPLQYLDVGRYACEWEASGSHELIQEATAGNAREEVRPGAFRCVSVTNFIVHTMMFAA